MNRSHTYPWVVVGLLWVVALLNYLDRQMLATMRPAMQIDIAELQVAANFGRLMAIFLWIYGLMSPVAGLLGDRLNRKWLIVGSLFVWSGVTFSMGYATSFEQLYALRALMGISEALYIPAGLALIADYHSGRTRSLAIGIHMTGLYMGQALGGFGATVAHAFSWQWAFQSFGLIGMVYAGILVVFLREHRVHNLAPDAAAEAKPSVAESLKVLLGNGSFWVLVLYFAVPSLPGWGVKNWLPTLFAEKLGLDMGHAGPIATITTALSSLLGVLVGGVVSDRWVQRQVRGRVYTSAIGLLLTVPALWLVGYGTTAFHVVGAAFCFGFGFGMFDANNMPILCQLVSARYRATAYGLMNLVGIFAGAFITDLMGKSTDKGTLGKDFAVLSVVVFLVVLLQLWRLRPNPAADQT